MYCSEIRRSISVRSSYSHWLIETALLSLVAIVIVSPFWAPSTKSERSLRTGVESTADMDAE